MKRENDVEDDEDMLDENSNWDTDRPVPNGELATPFEKDLI
jgi:hypothetical protein